MLIFYSSNKIYKYVYDTDGILKNISTCSESYKYRNEFSSINKENYFVIANNPPIIFTDENDGCSTLKGGVGEHGIRLAFFPSGYFTIANINNGGLVLFHYSKEDNNIKRTQNYPQYDDSNAIKIDNNFLGVILILFHVLLYLHLMLNNHYLHL